MFSLLLLPLCLQNLASLPGWDVKELKGGLTNQNYQVAKGGFKAVVRVPGQGSEKLGIDRDNEATVSRIAAALGVAPEVLLYSKKDRLFVTRFVDGTQVTAQTAARPEVLRALAASLRLVHEGPAFPRTFSPFESARGYLREARERGADLPPRIEAAMERLARIEKALAPYVKPKPIHADMHAGNVILDARGKAILLDWEYAGMGDPFADLATYAHEAKMSDAEMRALLQAYFGHVTERDFAHLVLLRDVTSLRFSLWYSLQAKLTRIEADYDSPARELFARFEANTAEPRLSSLLGQLSGN